MTEQTVNFLKQLKAENTQKNNLNHIFGIITVISLVICVLGAIVKNDDLLIMGVLAMSVFAFILLIRCLSTVSGAMGIRKSLQTMEKTGSIRYISEIFDKKYNVYGKEFLSEHIYYIPGALILGYSDIIDIRRVKNDYYFVTIDGKQHRTSAFQTKKETAEYLINTYDITSGASYKDYKHKIESFKKETQA